MNIRNEAATRGLGENIESLVEVEPVAAHLLLKSRYKSLMEEYFKGTITQESFDITNTRLWEAFFFRLDRLAPQNLAKFSYQLLGDSSVRIKTVLYFSASSALNPLGVDYEFSKIKDAIQNSSEPRLELLLPIMASTLENFVLELHKHHPYIIHFSGHGTGDGLVFVTADNQDKIISNDILEEVFKGVSSYASLVVLNACYSSAQARKISEMGLLVAGMNYRVSDAASISLSARLYRFINGGMETEEAIRQTKVLLASELPAEKDVFELFKNGQKIL